MHNVLRLTVSLAICTGEFQDLGFVHARSSKYKTKRNNIAMLLRYASVFVDFINSSIMFLYLKKYFMELWYLPV